jgi:hypothetical protein
VITFSEGAIIRHRLRIEELGALSSLAAESRWKKTAISLTAFLAPARG